MKIMISTSASERVRKQSGVIPYRLGKDGSIEVLLIESSHAGNWSLPKGKKEKHLTKRDSALVEAWEEAGLKGKTSHKLGEVEYRKGSTGVMQHVIFFAMEVDTMHMQYPEEWRKRKWFPIDKAAKKMGKKYKHLFVKLEALV